jgi:hypothetical protein
MKFITNQGIASVLLAMTALSVPAAALAQQATTTPITVNAIDQRKPWGVPTVTIGGSGGVAQVRITDAGMTTYDAVPGIQPEKDARFPRNAYNVAFLGAPHNHPILNELAYCLQPLDENNEIIGNEVCAKPSPDMTFTIQVRAGTTRLLPVMRRGGPGGERMGWGWQPERGSQPFEGWRAFGPTNTGDTIRLATAAEMAQMSN